MTRFVPRDKLSKKARRQLDKQQRLTWPFPPVAKTMRSKKDYKRHKKFHDYQEERNRGIFLFFVVFVIGSQNALFFELPCCEKIPKRYKWLLWPVIRRKKYVNALMMN